MCILRERERESVCVCVCVHVHDNTLCNLIKTVLVDHPLHYKSSTGYPTNIITLRKREREREKRVKVLLQ